MKIPSDLRYSKTHEWVRPESDGTMSVGITDFAQDQLGDIVFVEFPKIGRVLSAGDAAAVVESVKAAGDVYAPIAGEVIATNDALVDHWESINQDAYAAWLFRLKPRDPRAIELLLDAAAYTATAHAAAAKS